MNLTPILSRLRRTITRSDKDILELATRRWVLCGPENQVAPQALYLDGDFDKITTYWADTTPELEMKRLRGGERQHEATIAYEIADVELLEGSLYKSSRRLRLLPQKERLNVAGDSELIPKAALACTLYGATYFAHWLVDDLTLNLAGSEIGLPVIAKRKPYHHEAGYCELFGIEQYPVERAKLESVVTFRDFGQNSFKRQRYQTLRARLRASVKDTINSRVFIRRGSTGVSRSMVNTNEVEAFLISQGFAMVEPELLSSAELTRQMSGASLVMGIEGSHLIHGIVNMADGGTLCALIPPFRFNNLHKDYTDCLGMTYALLTGITTDGGFTIPIDQLKRLLDKIEARLP